MADYKLDDAPLEISLDPTWPAYLHEEFVHNSNNARVGMTLISTLGRVRIWHIVLAQGERLPVQGDFGTALSSGTGNFAFP